MTKVGIIGAMNEEIEHYLEHLTGLEKINFSGFIFYIGRVAGVEVVLVKSEVGKVNASRCTQALIDHFNISSIIFTGVAGALDATLNVGDVVISKDSVQYDLDASGLGFERGQIPFTNLKIFKASEELISLAHLAAKKVELRTITGRMVSGDQFIVNKSTADAIKVEFNGDCIDMESAAVAQVCYYNKIPHVIIRTISDKSDGSFQNDFKEIFRMAAQNSFLLIQKMLPLIRSSESDDFNLKLYIRTIPNWPKPGIMFRDITTLIQNPEAFHYCIQRFKEQYQDKHISKIVGIESRGFIFGAALAYEMNLPLVLIRKKGKLPAETVSQEYQLEYGTDKIEVHKDAMTSGDKVLIVDDLIATGGTLLAATKLVEKLGGIVASCAVVIELPDLKGREMLQKYDLISLVQFEGE